MIMIQLKHHLMVSLLISSMLVSLSHTQPVQVFNGYLEALMRSDSILAESFWISEEIELSKRLGIEYIGIEAKYDCASPVIENLNLIREGSARVLTGNPLMRGEWLELPVNAVQGKDTLKTTYYMVRRGDDWKLTAPLFVHTGKWSTVETKYATLHYNDTSLVNGYALRELDRFIDQLTRQLAIPEADMIHLAQVRIHYYLCNEAEIELLTGYQAQGMTNLQFDAVVTRQLPHYHELSHFMINYAMRRLPLYTLPCLQEGMACYLGGRWGKSPAIILYAGYYTYELGLTVLEEVLTYDGFHHQVGMPDITYPVSALLMKTTIDNAGIGRFRDLYLELSGTSREVIALSQLRVQMRIAQFTGQSWAEFLQDYESVADSYKYCGIIPGIQVDYTDSLTNINCDEITVDICESDESYCFKINGITSNINCTILLSDPDIDVEDNYRSWMFNEQHSDEEYSGETFGIRFSSSDAGLYNYLTNILSAKYISSFLPSEDYWDSESNILTFSLLKITLPRKLTDYRIRLVH